MSEPGLIKKQKQIQQLQIKDDVKDVFLLKYIAARKARDGKNYLNIALSDASGELECRMWNQDEQMVEKFPRGSYVIVSGKMNAYMGRKQLIIKEMQILENTEGLDESDFVAHSQHQAEEMFSELEQIVAGLEDVYIKELLQHVLGDEETARRLKLWQAGKTIHHAYQGGLLEHILSCTRLGISLSKHYNVNASYVAAGTILHDLCKIYEISDGPVVEYTEEGKLVGHLVKGVEILDRFCSRIKGFPYQMKLHLKHILLSHHGEYVYGSPKLPQTSEAYLVHLIDLMDSKMNSFETIKKTDQTPGHWSGYVSHMDRIVFKQELPTFTEMRAPNDERRSSGAGERSGPKKPRERKHRPPKELKQNLGKLFEGVKLPSADDQGKADS